MKILLLHGWNADNYTKETNSKDAWSNRDLFVKELEKKYEIYKLNFPGFCGEEEPNESWNLSDFAQYVKNYLDNNNLKVDYILGYSFGGAVATVYNRIYDNNQKLILISPAISRNYYKSIKFIQTPIVLNPVRNFFKDLYLKYIIKNEYMIRGTKFLNDTYQNIVREELIEDILKIDPKCITIIYGDIDEMANPHRVISSLKEEYQNRIHVIKNGGHNIAVSHTKEILDIIELVSRESIINEDLEPTEETGNYSFNEKVRKKTR